MPNLDPADYHVAWIAPLWIEHVAAINMLDDQHDGSFPHKEGRRYQVTAGQIGQSNVIIATLAGEYGNVTAADLASEIRIRFPRLQLCLLVGIAAGLPLLPDRDIRLGDVLVAVPSQSDAGVVTYNLGKTTPDGFVELRTLAQAAGLVRSTITMVRGEWEGLRRRPDLAQKTRFLSHYNEIKNWVHGVEVKGYPRDFSYPGQEHDRGPEVPMALPELAGSIPAAGTEDKVVVIGSKGENRDASEQHPARDERTCVWYGSIGTGGELVKDASRSAELRARYDIIGLEMEAYGAMTGLSTGVIRGVCDYGNEKKNKLWQPYAAARAAAYAKTVIIRAGHLNPDNEKGTLGDGQSIRLSLTTERELPLIHDSCQQDVESALSECINQLGLQRNDIFYASEPPESADKLCDGSNIEESLEWFTKSPEFQMWREKKHCAQLWLHSLPGDGKTVVMSYVRKCLPRYYGYTEKPKVASIFCSSDHTEDCLLASLASQFIRNDLRAHTEKCKIRSRSGSQSDMELTVYLWEVLELLITGVSAFQTVLLIDGIDALKSGTRSSFLINLQALEKKVQSNTTIRVLISSRPFSDIRDALAHYPEIERGKERNEFLHTLFFKEWNARETRIETVEGGSWLASNHEYLEWNRNERSNVLWIEGKPGSGKSTLSKIIVRQLKKEQMDTAQRDPPEDQGFSSPTDWSTIIAEFYYSFRGGITETSHELMLRSIVYQIWKQNSRLFPLLQARYRHRLKEMGDNETQGNTFWSYDDLKAALPSLHQIDFSLKVVIVIDGMDESDNTRRDDVLKFLTALSTQTSHCSIKLLIASRPEANIRSYVAQVRRIVLQKENTEDIRKVADAGIEKLKGLSKGSSVLPSEQDYDQEFSAIEAYIVGNSHGVFLWVSLILRELVRLVIKGGFTITSLNKRVRSLPKDLGGPNGFYRAMVDSLLKRDDEEEDAAKEDRDRGRRIFSWVTFPKRPISIFELRDALAIPPLSEHVELSKFDLRLNRPQKLEDGIFSYCGGLVEVRDTYPDKIVQLIHQTVREFLLDRNHLAKPFDIDALRGDTEIAATCCRYIRIAFIAATPQAEADEHFSLVDFLTSCLSELTLLKYSLTNFTAHLDQLGHEGEEIRKEFEVFTAGLGASPTSYASLLLSRWVESLTWPRKLRTGVNARDAMRCIQTALTHAAGAGKNRTVEILLALRADINRRDRNGTYPLANAAASGQLSTVTLLLGSRARVGARDSNGQTALSRAAENGHEDIVQLLLERGAELEGADLNGQTALLRAAGNGHTALVDFLIKKGAEIQRTDKRGQTALSLASANGHKKTVEPLIGNGADLQAKNNIGQTALSQAIENGHFYIGILLINKGANVHTRDIDGQTALTHAVKRGSTSMVFVLLKNGAGADIQVEDHNGQTPLSQAHSRVAWLLEKHLAAAG